MFSGIIFAIPNVLEDFGFERSLNRSQIPAWLRGQLRKQPKVSLKDALKRLPEGDYRRLASLPQMHVLMGSLLGFAIQFLNQPYSWVSIMSAAFFLGVAVDVWIHEFKH